MTGAPKPGMLSSPAGNTRRGNRDVQDQGKGSHQTQRLKRPKKRLRSSASSSFPLNIDSGVPETDSDTVLPPSSAQEKSETTGREDAAPKKKLRKTRGSTTSAQLSTTPARTVSEHQSPLRNPMNRADGTRISPIRRRLGIRQVPHSENRSSLPHRPPVRPSPSSQVSALRVSASGRSGATASGARSSGLQRPKGSSLQEGNLNPERTRDASDRSSPPERAVKSVSFAPTPSLPEKSTRQRGFTRRRPLESGKTGTPRSPVAPPDLASASRSRGIIDIPEPIDTDPCVTSSRTGLGAEGEVSRLRVEIAELKERVNDYKRKLSEAEQDRDCVNMLNRAAMSDLKAARSEVDSLRIQNESLKASREIDVASRRGSRSRGVGGSNTLKISVETRFLGIAEGVAKQMLVWAQREVSELRPELSTPTRNWRNRSDTGVEVGIPFVPGGDDMCIPLPPLFVAGRREYYTPSFRSEKDIILAMARDSFSSSRWSSVFTTEDLRSACEKALVEDRFIQRKVKQTLSDTLSKKKRDARDKLFQTLGYNMLLSRRTGLSTDLEFEEKVRQKENAKMKLLRHVEGESKLDMSWWRTATAEELAYENYAISERLRERVEGDLFFKNAAAVQVMEEFLGFSPVLEDGTIVQSSILYLARLDAWLATVVKCLGIPEGRGGQRQRTFNDYYHNFLMSATEQILAKVCDHVFEHNPEELKVEQGSESAVLSRDRDTRIATAVVEVPSSKKYYIAVRPEWFRENVSKILGDVLDCYIAEVPVDGGELKLMGVRTEQTTHDTDNEDSRDASALSGKD